MSVERSASPPPPAFTANLPDTATPALTHGPRRATRIHETRRSSGAPRPTWFEGVSRRGGGRRTCAFSRMPHRRTRARGQGASCASSGIGRGGARGHAANEPKVRCRRSPAVRKPRCPRSSCVHFITGRHSILEPPVTGSYQDFCPISSRNHTKSTTGCVVCLGGDMLPRRQF